MNENLLIDIPIFIPKYDKSEKYGYSKEKEKQLLKKLLLETSNGHCMYCYTRLINDNKDMSHIEHSIEKSNSYKLEDCNINIAVTCSTCNLSFKKKGENKRKLTKEEIECFEKNSDCSNTCTIGCNAYNDLKNNYIKKKEAEIILQPFGIFNKSTKNEYKIQYDLLNQNFIYSKKYDYNDYEKNFINNHIKRFNLNDAKYRTKEVIKVCEDVIDFKQIPKKERYSNLIAGLFIDKLNNMKFENVIKLCEIIKLRASMTFKD